MAHIQYVSQKTGKIIAQVIELWPDRFCGECPMCEQYRLLDHAVAWCCEPTHDEIGSMSTVYIGYEVGGMSVCKECHDRHYAEPE